MSNTDGDLGIILGATVGALIDRGYALAEIHRWVDAAADTRAAVRPIADRLKASNG